MKYKYNSDLECFERFNNEGKPIGKKLWVNIVEARKIVTLYNLGNTVGLIQSKMNFASNKASGHTVETIIKLYKNEEIELDGDFPAPSKDFEELSVDGRIDDLERRIEALENKECSCSSEKSVVDKVKSWF